LGIPASSTRNESSPRFAPRSLETGHISTRVIDLGAPTADEKEARFPAGPTDGAFVDGRPADPVGRHDGREIRDLRSVADTRRSPNARGWLRFFHRTGQRRGAATKDRGALLLLDESFRKALPMIFEFLGVPDPDLPSPRMDPEACPRELYTVIKRITQLRGQRASAVALFEDLHWFDGGSEALLEQLVEALPGTRFLRVVTSAPNTTPAG
jgi:hypothetical protein